jgi:predicted dienelactone hydrolase
VLLVSGAARGQPAAYDPLSTADARTVQTHDLAALDEQRNRLIPVFLFTPVPESPAPVIVFSLGLARTREDFQYLGEHWAARGYAAAFVQHPGSDASVWRDKPPAEQQEAIKRAGSVINLLLRTKDIPATIDQLQRWNDQAGHPLRGRLDMQRVGISGHAFGALTAQTIGGQLWGKHKKSFANPRIKAAVLISPSSFRHGQTASAFSQVEIPWLIVTGTKDTLAWEKGDPQARLAVFPALPPGDKYELVLDGAEHSAFSDHPLPDGAAPRNPNHHRAIVALSTAFWDAYLRDDPAAKAWLAGNGPRSVLEERDRWQSK